MHALKILVYSGVERIIGAPSYGKTIYIMVAEGKRYTTYFLMMFRSSARVVRSIDLTMILTLGVMGEFASFSGLKFRTVDMILFEIEGLERISVPKLFRVAVTSKASLYPVRHVPPW